MRSSGAFYRPSGDVAHSLAVRTMAPWPHCLRHQPRAALGGGARPAPARRLTLTLTLNSHGRGLRRPGARQPCSHLLGRRVPAPVVLLALQTGGGHQARFSYTDDGVQTHAAGKESLVKIKRTEPSRVTVHRRGAAARRRPSPPSCEPSSQSVARSTRQLQGHVGRRPPQLAAAALDSPDQS